MHGRSIGTSPRLRQPRPRHEARFSCSFRVQPCRMCDFYSIAAARPIKLQVCNVAKLMYDDRIRCSIHDARRDQEAKPGELVSRAFGRSQWITVVAVACAICCSQVMTSADGCTQSIRDLPSALLLMAAYHDARSKESTVADLKDVYKGSLQHHQSDQAFVFVKAESSTYIQFGWMVLREPLPACVARWQNGGICAIDPSTVACSRSMGRIAWSLPGEAWNVEFLAGSPNNCWRREICAFTGKPRTRQEWIEDESVS